jgi:hypothetical protein
MTPNFFQRRKILKKANYLLLTPVRVHNHKVEENGNVTLIVPKFKKKWMRNFFVPSRKSEHFRIILDEIGSATWLAIDGKSDVQTICNRLGVQLGDKIDHAEERVTKFLTLLYDQRYVTFKEIL